MNFESKQRESNENVGSQGQSHRRMSYTERVARQRNAEQSRPQNKPEAARERTSSSNIMQGDHGTPKPRDRKLELQQSLWEERQRQDNHVAPNSRQRKSNTGQQYWRPKQGGHGASSRSERPDVIRSQNQESLKQLRQKKIPLRGGGGNPEESSSQQQKTNRREEFKDKHRSRHDDLYKDQVHIVSGAGFQEYRPKSERVPLSQQQWDNLNKTINDDVKYVIERQQQEREGS